MVTGSDHTSTPSRAWVLALADHPALGDVRRWTQQRLDGIVEPDVLQDIVMVVDELVTNAELHTECPERLTVSYGSDSVRIEVFDGSHTAPVLQPRSLTRTGGRGIQLVEAVSADWGVRQGHDGKVVWSVVALAW